MRGIILAGGTGSRLKPLTNGINKHVFPIGRVPMIWHSLELLRDNGIIDITIVSTAEGISQIAKAIDDHGLSMAIDYRVQSEPSGIVGALECATNSTHEGCVVILGDNIFFPTPEIDIDIHENRCWLYAPKDNRQFGVPTFDGPRLTRITEKPAKPDSPWAVTGLYKFTAAVWNAIGQVRIGERGETEVTDLLNLFAHGQNADLRNGAMLQHTIHHGFWGDAGTFDGLEECSRAAMGYAKEGA